MSGVGEWLALGTVQLGTPYGVANRAGQPADGECRRILDEAWAGGIRWFDTAQGYGDSERVLGDWWRARSRPQDFRAVTKLHPRLDPRDEAALLQAVEQSLDRLGMRPLWGLMLHREFWLDAWGGGLGRALEQARGRGWVERLGVSVYAPDRALAAIGNPAFSIFQAPLNVFDRRMVRAGVLEAARKAGKKVFLRSVYLQGLALMPAAEVPARLGPRAALAVRALEDFCREAGVPRAKFCLDYVRCAAPEGLVVLGAERAGQVRDNIALAEAPSVAAALFEAWDRRWPEDDPAFIDPSQWLPAGS